MTSVSPKNKLDNIWLQLGIIVVATFIAYSRIFHAGFVSWDDNE